MKPQLLCDLECYSNYFLVMFMRMEDDHVKFFEISDSSTLNTEGILDLFDRYEVITFNGNKYDIPLIKLALTGCGTTFLKKASDEIINGMWISEFEKTYNIPQYEWNHIDLIEVCTGKASLKLYGARLHSQKLQDLPIEPNAVITKEQEGLLRKYCRNDLAITKLLYQTVEKQIQLRRNMSNQYRIDLRSKSDAQMAEAVIRSKIVKKTGKHITKPTPEPTFIYKKPEFILVNKDLQKPIDIVTTKPFTINRNGNIEMPKELSELKIKIGHTTYQMGMGGLHSTEKSCHFIANNKTIIIDADVASYYPSIILNCGLYPKHLGPIFLDIYKDIVEERLEAKAMGNKVKADSLKITINGSFGKFGSQYSILYAPDLMIQVTVTGQLSLLMLISELEANGIQVISGNTDGIVIYTKKDNESKITEIITKWENITGFSMERNDYTGLYSRDVNNYIAIKIDGKVKTKGCFSDGCLTKNPQNEICNEALIKYLTTGEDFENTIYNCKDITKFLTVRTVKGGAVNDKGYVGKTIRWYRSNSKNLRGKTITYKNGNKVPRTENCQVLMDIPEQFPSDVDYKWYIDECYELLNDVGINIRGQMCLF